MPLGFLSEITPGTPIQIASKLIDSGLTINELHELTDHLSAYVCRKRRDEAELNQSGGEALCQK